MDNTPDEYYVQNKQAGYLGNSPTWWAKGGRGYTAYILGAQRFTKAQAEKMVTEDPSKWRMFRCDDIDKRLHLIFDSQDIPRLGTEEPCGWECGYAPTPQPHPPVTADEARAVLEFINEWNVQSYGVSLPVRKIIPSDLFETIRCCFTHFIPDQGGERG